MAISHKNGIAVANISHFNGIAKANVSAINGVTAGFGGGFDSDAQAFFTATGISDGTIQAAIDAFVIGLKADSLWTKMIALYPFVGGTSGTHAVNLKSPGTHDISFAGTVSHTSNGITPNGSTGYGNTGVVPNTHLSSNNTHMSLYSRSAGTSGDAWTDMGCSDGSGNFLTLKPRFFDLCVTRQYGAGAGGQLAPANTNAQGFYLTCRTSSTAQEVYKNGSSLASSGSTVVGARPTEAIYIGAENQGGTAGAFGSYNYAFASIGAGLDDTEAANFHTRVETFQDALSRGVV